ncbi:pantetheine-phosphate adenylyltransferase [Undibacterium sp. TJN19]|uniref:pantetheine-phosphate adenylyltransferase n=1 Tax=Undibacterium sp. TJN19 TaxID=3413055 RepID=UPI003BF2ED07
MKKIAFSGTLDPITNGHMWVIQEARAMASEVVIFISENPGKKPQFPAEKRKAIIEQSLALQGWDDVSVMLIKGDYTARAAKRLGIDYLIRGIRNTSDFDYENLIQQTNVDVLHGAKTIFIMPPRDLGSVSSSFVRALQGPVGWHWSVKQFLPKPAYTAWLIDWLQQDWASLWQLENADIQARAALWFERLTGETAYGSAARHYHNLDHLVHGLSEITAWGRNINACADDVATLKKAFWFHDVVYDVPHGDLSNEEASARLWLESSLPKTAGEAEDVASLIRATDHLQENAITHKLKQVMLSVDLAILGQTAHVYNDYAVAIRAEYAIVEESMYKIRRKQILEYFLQQATAGTLLPDAYFSSLYGQSAVENLGREIADLTGAV